MLSNHSDLYSIFRKHNQISTDSRHIIPGSIFFALKGDNFNGNKYANAAIGAGAACAVIDEPEYKSDRSFLVDDVLEALQQLAQQHRNHFNIPVIAITGSNGKTTTKELTNAVLGQQFHVTATKGNLNNHIGVPLTLLCITNETEVAIVEMGANHQGEIAALCEIAKPTHGLITNIGKAHLSGFGGYEGVIKAKSELYNFLKNNNFTAYVNQDNPLLMGLSEGIKKVVYGTGGNIFASGKINGNTTNLEIDWDSGKGIVGIKTNLIGDYNFENVMAAICIGSDLGVPPEKIKTAISSYIPSNSRSQAMKTANNSIVLDAYNANPTSMRVAVENFSKLEAEHKMVILGDMLELGDESLAEHFEIVSLIEDSGFEKAIFVGPHFSAAAGIKFPCFLTSDEAANWLTCQQISDFLILVKGSRGIKMEKVLESL
ncbi:MAG: UDP-N-acetylmuramoyl-tripeptide--D-alanyl-D-alanine ligase [Bacteroidales bacterium]